MSETPNEIPPRAVAVALISEMLDDVRRRIDAHRRHARDAGDLFHSRILVYLEQVGVELRRAARYLEETDMSDEG